jgi:predicted N-formylglutamate amidohydrolase
MFELDLTAPEGEIARPDAAVPKHGGLIELHHPQGKAPCLVLCDHAGRRVPKRLEHLGLPEHELRRHIGWDIGAAEVARGVAVLLDAPALLCHVSRLVIDANRRPGRADSIPAVSDGTPVPGNQEIEAAEARRRLRECFIPYHRAVARRIGRLRRRVGAPAIVSIHSFTPMLQGGWRPWQVAVLWDEDDRLAAPMLAGLRRDPALHVGDNEPYSGRYPVGYTIPFHARRPGLPHVTVELRQDLIDTRPRARAWAERLAAVLRGPLQDPALFRLWQR